MRKSSIWPKHLIQILIILNAHVWPAISALLSIHVLATIAVSPGLLRVLVKKNQCNIAKDRLMMKSRIASSIFNNKSRIRFLSQPLSKVKWLWSLKKKNIQVRSIVKENQQTNMKSKVKAKIKANRSIERWWKRKRNRRQPMLQPKELGSLRETSLRWY